MFLKALGLHRLFLAMELMFEKKKTDGLKVTLFRFLSGSNFLAYLGTLYENQNSHSGKVKSHFQPHLLPQPPPNPLV